MSLFISKKTLVEDLEKACQGFPDVPVVVHSDLLKIGLTSQPTARLEICRDYEQALQTALKERPLLIPTFNYDFCKTGVYDCLHSPSQVGALSDYFRLQYPQLRSLTPIFNFVILHKNEPFSLTASHNVLGTDSLFDTLYKQKGLVLFLGAPFSTNTFIHYVEECNHIGYRYLIIFSWVLVDQDKETPIVVDYRVRPLMEPTIRYDFPKLLQEAKSAQVVKECVVGHGMLLYFETEALFNFWSKKMQEDALYLLTEESKKQVEELSQVRGYAF